MFGHFNVCLKRCLSLSHKITYLDILATLLLLSGALNMNIFLFLLLVLTIISVSAEKSNLDDPVLFCDGCFALVSEIEKDMSVRYVGRCSWCSWSHFYDKV